jgi:hypothetical protein
MEYGSSCQVYWFECVKNGPPPKGHPANLAQVWEALESTWASIPVEGIRHLLESMLRRIEAVLRAKGGCLTQC